MRECLKLGSSGTPMRSSWPAMSVVPTLQPVQRWLCSACRAGMRTRTKVSSPGPICQIPFGPEPSRKKGSDDLPPLTYGQQRGASVAFDERKLMLDSLGGQTHCPGDGALRPHRLGAPPPPQRGLLRAARPQPPGCARGEMSPGGHRGSRRDRARVRRGRRGRTPGRRGWLPAVRVGPPRQRRRRVQRLRSVTPRGRPAGGLCVERRGGQRRRARAGPRRARGRAVRRGRVGPDAHARVAAASERAVWGLEGMGRGARPPLRRRPRALGHLRAHWSGHPRGPAPVAARVRRVVQPARHRRLFERCIAAPPSVRFDTFYVTSNNRWGYRDLTHARKLLGWEPLDRAEDHR